MDPRNRGARVNPVPGSQVDILPTLLDLLAVPLPAGQLYQGSSLYSEAAQQPRPIYLQSYRDKALVLGNEYLWIENYQKGMTEAEAVTRRFSISNDGARTLYAEQPAGNGILDQHLEFEIFQHSLIVHYGHYQDQIVGEQVRTVVRSETVSESKPVALAQ